MPHSQVKASGNRVVLHFDSLEDAMRLLSPRRGSKPPMVAAEGIHAALGAAGLAMEIRVGGHMLVKLGAARSVSCAPPGSERPPSPTSAYHRGVVLT